LRRAVDGDSSGAKTCSQRSERHSSIPPATASAALRWALAAKYAMLIAPTLVPTSTLGRWPAASSAGSNTDNAPIS
jgi:hypothetical protein